MKECKILSMYHYNNHRRDLGNGAFDYPGLEAWLNEYLKDGWEIKTMTSLGSMFIVLERDI